MEYRKGDNVIINDNKLKTNGCHAVIQGKHYNDYWHGSYFNGCYDVLIKDYHGKELVTYVNKNKLNLVI